MTIRTRLSSWYAAIMFIALLAMGALLYNELVIQPRRDARRHQRAQHAEHHPQHRDHWLRMDPDIYEDVTGIVMWCGVPAALLAIAGGWWLMKKSLAPIAALTAAAEKITAQNLAERLPRARSGDELDRLTDVFNSMLQRLEASFSHIREFTLHASHELKTPLTVLCGETETALRDESLAPSERERAASQLDELRRLARIVDGLTLLTKADAGQVTLSLEATPVDELVRDNFADAQILAEPLRIRVELTACEPAVIRGDRHRLRQLLLNLADNAVKYNQSGGKISMSLRRVNNLAEFKISNTGPGISADVLARVFDRFYRGDPAHESALEGCGLGLSIAKWIVSAHDGTIQIQSAPGQLTIVTVRLPLNDAAR